VFPHCGQATESSGMISGTPEMGVGPAHRDDAIGGCETAIGISPHPRRCVVSRIRTHGVAQASIRSERRSTVVCAGAGATPSRFETLARCLSEAAAVRTTDRQSDPKCLASLCRSSLRPSPLPRRHRIRISPQAAPMLARGFIRGGMPGRKEMRRLRTTQRRRQASRRYADRLSLRPRQAE
jgi:hypothetical protein